MVKSINKNIVLKAALAACFISTASALSAAEKTAYGQLCLEVIGVPCLGFTPLSTQCPEAGLRADTRFLTGSHSPFSAAIIRNNKWGDSNGDYYPYSGGIPGNTDANGNAMPAGLLSGMGSEAGHPTVFANGGNTERLWEDALKKYKGLDFAGAYEDIGLICHLTQDQAVPAHAANINHVITFGDRFEWEAADNISFLAGIKGEAEVIMPPKLPPYEYYQALQDDTRRHLLEWTDPRTGAPYWPPAPDAPPLGEDATKGPWSHYSNRKDTYDKNLSPGILERQMLKAAVYTAGVLNSAANLLPPAIGGFKALRREDNRFAVDVSFNIYDNRRGDIKLRIERPLYEKPREAVVHVVSDGSTIPSGTLALKYSPPAAPIEGKDLVVVTAEDPDGNITREQTEVSYRVPDNYPYGGY